MYLKKRLDSFRHAFRGVGQLFASTPNARIHLVMAIAAVALGFAFTISHGEWIAVIIVIGLVISLEALNSAIEVLADYITKEQHPNIKRLKDMAAASVLISALAALIVGLIIFLPKIIAFFC